MPGLLTRLVSAVICLVVCSLIIPLTLFLFTRLAKYNDWEEVAKGNLGTALALGERYLGWLIYAFCHNH